ncbi:glucose-6-phosphate dehydrogenase assembly protein OpcA [Nocardioides sp.]|jgi:glucose-6-phosphate dehydrogenase assembly protein OpcA|uniref:glucose-6-phosphate dehydrogenase assembly protein OpcA n=1 Tax=Nocardioides sp. TaxID=35761 RepID=UPI002D004477|nr:glucose-6-phosphate dehydrogenase assembly protein OpcA [Nocardioides sp.]HVX53214.1 glucose-6-phosphate dehydrogenase assembly protein OpcA [Nocardioides sp.]
MTTTLTATNSAAIAAEFVRARTRAGSPAMGMVMTVVVVVEEQDAAATLEAARAASHEHPARVLGVVLGSSRGAGQVDAEVTVGAGWGGEMALLRLVGEVVKHPDSVVLPLLLPDSPVVAWWASRAPRDLAGDPLGRLAQRRITDSAAAAAQARTLQVQCAAYSPGNTDLSWTRLTPWRALLAAALDQHPLKVTGASVAADRGNPSADLLAAWLGQRLRVDVRRITSDGPGLTEVTLETKKGPIRISRPDGRLATFSSPGNPDRPVALRRRDVPELLAEELRRLDEDDVYAATARFLARGLAAKKTPTRKGKK